MNNKVIAKNRIIKLLSILVVAILAIAVAIGILLLLKQEDTDKASPSYSIIVDDEITVYEGDTFTLVPYLVNKDGTVVESRFDYTASDDAISVDIDGVISVNSIPEKDVQVSIFERNTSTTAEVNVNIVGKLTKVLGITFSDAAGNTMLVSGKQDLRIGDTYVIDVVTEPHNVQIQDYCQLQAFNESGTEKDVFEFTYSKTNVSMTVVGLGAGTLQLDIANDDGQSLYNTDFDFSISMDDEILGEEILNGTNSTLLSKDELRNIETVELSQDVSDLEDLQYLTSLKTIEFLSDEVMDVFNISQSYCYRIKADIFKDYIDSDIWSDYIKCIIPYEENTEELYVVYHNSKTASGNEDITYERLENLSSFPIYIYEGYTNSKWLDGQDVEVSVSQIKSSVKLNGIHLYAGWEPIKYKVVYHIRDDYGTNHEDTLYEDDWYYDQEDLLKTPIDLGDSISRKGYKFAGWSRNVNSSVFSTNIQYRKDEPVSNLTSEAGATIDLYDIWEPIEYTLIFSTVEGMEVLEDMAVKYNTSYTLPTPSRPGYEFIYWKLANGGTLNAGINDPNNNPQFNLSSLDGEEIILTPEFNEITYTIKFKLNGGHADHDLSIVEGYKKSLRYTESYTLPHLTREGYTVYSWYCDSNHKTYGSVDRIVGEFTTTCEVTFEAIWTSAVYTINYDCNGGNLNGEGYVTSNRFWDDGASLLIPTRTGYSFVKWQDSEHNVEYMPNGEGWASNLIKSEAESGAQFNLKAVWEINYYDLKISTGTGTTLTVKVNNEIKADGTHRVAYNSTITVSYSANTGYSNATCTFSGGTMPAKNQDIISSATINRHSVTISIGGGSYMTVNIGGASYSSSQTVSNIAYGTPISVSSYGANSGYQDAWYSCGYSSMPDYDITISSGATETPQPQSSCFAKGTMLMLSDGASVAVENLKINDFILTFDHSTGQYVENRILYTYYDYGFTPSIELYFSNNAFIELLNVGHGLFDITLNRYVLINADNVHEYVGHEFLYTNFLRDTFATTSVKLETYKVSEKLIERYDIVTESTLNHIANGLLACSDTLVGICNMFKFDDDFTYDLAQLEIDIETYGLYTYDEWSEYLSYEDFVAFNGAYFKIAVGKGLITIEEIFSLLNDLAANR